MASILPGAPRASLRLHAKQLQRTRQVSTAASPFPDGLFKPPHSIIKPWKCVTGAQEWQTSTYHYNKQSQKTLPVATETADKLLRDYSTMIKSRGLASTGASSTARNAMAARRRDPEKMYVSKPSVKDYGDKIVVKAYMFDAAGLAFEERKERMEMRRARGEAAKKEGGAQGGRRRRPVGAAARRGSPGAVASRFGPAAARAGAARPPPGARAMPPGGTIIKRFGPSRSSSAGGRPAAPAR